MKFNKIFSILGLSAVLMSSSAQATAETKFVPQPDMPQLASYEHQIGGGRKKYRTKSRKAKDDQKKKKKHLNRIQRQSRRLNYQNR